MRDVQRYAYKIFYDGSELFYGSQRQPSLRTVEGELISGLRRTNAMPSDPNAARFAMAGRTDRFVSALGNVFAVTLENNLTPAAINSKLKNNGIRIWASAKVQDSFNPRRALTRRYRYFAHIAKEMDLRLLIETSKLFLGMHDFRNFSQRPSNENSLRSISDLSIDVLSDSFICFDIVGDSFLRRMVRRIVGSLMGVANGLLNPKEIQALFDPNDRIPKAGVPSAPAEGLVLWDVDYGFPFEIDEYAVKKLRESLVESMRSFLIKKTILSKFIEINER